MHEEISRLHQWLSGQEDAMVDLLRDVVNIDSNSHDKQGVDAVGTRFRDFFQEHGIATRTLPLPAAGDVLIAEIGPVSATDRPIMMLGHRDTVFPTGEVAQRPFSIVDGVAYGPGVCDMKGGLVQNAFVLAAFHHTQVNPPSLMVMMTSDEEIGSPSCREIIIEYGRKARAVFNSEPARPTGNVVTGRRGGMILELVIEGRSAHSGGNFTEGISAIGELAGKITALHALSDVEAGYTVNVGVVEGGQSHNTVAPSARALIDCRFVTVAQRDALKADIDEIVRRSFVPGTRSRLEILARFDPMEPNEGTREMLEIYRQSAADLGMSVEGEFSGGCADSGFTHNAGCPSLCGTGPMGWKAHTAEEYLRLDSLVPRAQLLAGAVWRRAQSN
ncbi:M20 family metallopeptidase [Aquamicrobium sp. NLF2-7]|uniref:M20 family metallopeptidase n=1 Tax=Aquamicrobium sp. NLF2-7 TaxID=2918753 RepID=UPI001EFBE425|nr:M20 family metallopeptidase [Aquamicrobium sp. NLF2-7]MCG8272652.1 M20 family metallopeptidase [Aquamicrobium sp. NLF2-7]